MSLTASRSRSEVEATEVAALSAVEAIEGETGEVGEVDGSFQAAGKPVVDKKMDKLNYLIQSKG